MLRLERHARILELVQERGFLETSDLANIFGVSVVTIRRDLKALVDQQLVALQHGGVSAVDYFHGEIEPLYDTKTYINATRKKAIGRAAVSLISEGETVILDAGTTSAALAAAIRRAGFKHLRVFTNDLVVAKTLCNAGKIEVVMIGGLLRSSFYSAYGPLAEMCLRDLHANKLFLGIDAATVTGGISNIQLEEVPVKQRMIEISDKVIVLADSSKFSADAPYRVCDWSRIEALVTDAGLTAGLRAHLSSTGVTLYEAVASEENGRRATGVESGATH